MAFMIATILIVLTMKIFLDSGNARSINGANFCHVDKIKAFIHEIADITDGNHKWQGTTPSLRKRADNRINIDMFESIEILHWLKLPISIKAEPKAWARKYLIEASVSWLIFMLRISGINLIKFNSIAVQARNQLGLDNAIIVLVISVDEKIKVEGDNGNMKDLEELNPQIMVRSLYFEPSSLKMFSLVSLHVTREEVQ